MDMEQSQRLTQAVDICADGIFLFATEQDDYVISYANAAAESLFGIAKDALVGKSFLQLLEENGDGLELKSLHHALIYHQAEKTIFMLAHKDDMPLFCQLHISPIEQGFIAILMDISGNKAFSERLAYQSTHDVLTGLPNRTLVIDRIDQAIVQTQRYDFLVGVLYLDIDHFKTINDTHQFEIGDEVLQEVGVRLTKCVRETDAVARVNQDEFVIALPLLAKEEECHYLIKQIMHTLKTPIKIKEVEIVVSCCIGVSFYPYQGLDAQTLLKNAKIAMERAKTKGQDTWQEYVDDMVLNIQLNK